MKRKKLIGLGGAIIVFGAVLLVILNSRPEPLMLQPLPNPNGYMAFVQAAELVSRPPDDLGSVPIIELERFVSTNEAAFQIFGTGLTMKCRVPLNDPNTLAHYFLRELTAFKKMAYALEAKGKLAELEGDPESAAQNYISIFQFGHEIPRGGTLMHELVADAIQLMGSGALKQLVPKLSAQQCKTLISQVEEIERSTEPIENILRTEKAYMHTQRNGVGTVEYIKEYVNFMVQEKSLTPGRALFKQAEKGYEVHRSQAANLLLDLAGRAFELDHGHKAGSHAEFVPHYLKALPNHNGATSNIEFHLF